MGAALKFRTTNVPRQQGERARIKVVRGPDYGSTYVVTDRKATVGRGEDNDVVISDLKSSRNHAEFTWTQNGWLVRDLGSANGILHNGKTARSAKLAPGDTITVGETVLEFMTADQGTMMLVAPVRDLEKIQAEQSAFEAQKRRVRSIGQFGGGAAAPNSGVKSPQDQKKVIIYAVIGIGVAIMMLSPDDKQKPKPKAKPAVVNPTGADLEKYLPGAEGGSKQAEIFFKNGFREYRQGNWLRAKSQFETVLQMSPGHVLAQLYLTNCETKITEEVKAHLDVGGKNLRAGKLKEAKGEYEAVLRLLYRDQTNPSYIEATDQLAKVVKEMKGEVTN